MKIAIVCPEYLPVPACNGGAVETLITYIIEDNEKYKNLEIDLYSLYDKKNENIKYLNTNFYFIKENKLLTLFCKFMNIIPKVLGFKLIYRMRSYNIKLIKKFKKNKNKYDKVIVENCMYLYNDLYKVIKEKCPIYYHMHNDVDNINKPVYLTKFITCTARKILTVSEYLKKRVLEIDSGANVEVLYNCVDIEKFSFNKEKRNLYRLKYKIDVDDYIFMFSGRITDDKGVYELICAFNNLKTKKKCKLLIVGTTWFGSNKLSDYQKKLNSLSYSNVIFTGYIANDEMPNIYNMSDCVIIPSKWEEPFGVVGLEAMANCKKIIVTKSGGLMEFLNSNNSIVISKEKNMIEEITNAMKYVISTCNLTNIQNVAYRDLLNDSRFNRKYYYSNFIKKIKD